MTARVLVLGAGFGGLEVAAGLSERFGGDVRVTLIDKRADFVFGFAKLDVISGEATAEQVRYAYAGIRNPGVEFVRAEITAIDPDARVVTTDAGTYEADHLVIALGADLDASATPGMTEGGHEYYSTEGAFAARDVLAGFTGGRVVVGVATPVFKCPPAPSETALMIDGVLRERGLRERSEIALVMPWPSPVPPVPAASQAFLETFAERGIRFHGDHVIDRLDAASREVVFSDGHRLGYDLFLGVPKHVVPPVVAASGLAPDGWIAVDRQTFRTGHDEVYAIGDAADAGVPKAGTFATGQARVVTAEIAARIDPAAAVPAYDGSGICYIGFGGGTVAQIGGTFRDGAPVHPVFESPSAANAAVKEEFRRTQARRWLGA